MHVLQVVTAGPPRPSPLPPATKGGRAAAAPLSGALGRGRVAVALPGKLRGAVALAAGKDDSGDFVTNLVGKIFGKAVLEDENPAGLKRMTKEEWPDQWLAVTDEWAGPVAGDSKDAAVIRPMLKQTQLEAVPLGLAYDAKKDGWSHAKFHKKLDGLGAAVILGKTAGGAVFGGYNPKGWLGYGDWRDAISAFLFTWPDGDTSKRPLKLPKAGGSGMAIVDEPGKGPQWGPDGLKINIDNRTAASRLGPYYERLPGGGKTLFTKAEGSSAEVVELKIFVGLEETAKAKDYKPNMLQWQKGELEGIREKDNKRK